MSKSHNLRIHMNPSINPSTDTSPRLETLLKRILLFPSRTLDKAADYLSVLHDGADRSNGNSTWPEDNPFNE
jgi:hypothetical protein